MPCTSPVLTVGRLQAKEAVPLQQLLALTRLSNQAVGDALSGILMVEAALSLLNWDLGVWLDLYTDLPSRQLKVLVLAHI